MNERSQVRVLGMALDKVFFLLVYDDIRLACDFDISFHSLSLFFLNLGKLDIPGTFHVISCSFPIFHELESTDI